MNPSDKIYVAGHNGLIGSAIVRHLLRSGYTNIVIRNRNELDITLQTNVISFFEREKPDYVFLQRQKLEGFMRTVPIEPNFSTKT